MKQSPSERNDHENLLPSKFAGEGFLGTDTRSFHEIVLEDSRALAASGVSKDAIVSRLKETYRKAKEAFGNDITIAPHVTAVFFESMGKIPCPFRGDGVFEKGEVMLTDTVTEHTVYLSSLSIHLIEKHDFFQGKGARYRIDPAEIIAFLQIPHGAGSDA